MDIVILSLILVLLGIAIGLFASIIGLGGGFLIVPILILIFGLPTKNAIAISLVAICGTTISATIGYFKQKRLILNSVFFMTYLIFQALFSALI